MDLPGTLASAEQKLELSEQQIVAQEQALELIQLRTEVFANQVNKKDSGEISFQLTDLTSAEGELYNLIHFVNNETAVVNFDTMDQPAPNWLEVRTLFESSLGDLKRLFTQFASIETSLQGSLIGSTVVSWSGKYVTSWHAGTHPESMRLHQRSLKVAMASRRLFLNMFSVSAISAARLSVLLAVPGGALFTLPAVWKFVTRILNEIEIYHTLNT